MLLLLLLDLGPWRWGDETTLCRAIVSTAYLAHRAHNHCLLRVVMVCMVDYAIGLRGVYQGLIVIVVDIVANTLVIVVDNPVNTVWRVIRITKHGII